MASIFLSHSSRDRAAAEQVSARLRAAGFAALFVDFDPEQGIPAGRDWEQELYAQLRRSDAVVFLASGSSVTSSWCFLEVGLARSLGRPVFPLRLQPGVRLPLLEDVQWVDMTDIEAGVARLLTGMQAAGLDPADSFSWDPRRSPYPGLTPFVAEDAGVFFGREQETRRLVELLQPTLQHGPGRFVAVVGPSGSGKSSLVRAGLLPRLLRLPQEWLVLPPLLPGRDPIRNLAGCLARAFTDRGCPRSADELVTVLDRGPDGLVDVVHALTTTSGNGSTRPRTLVVLDQAEELLTRSAPGQQQAFLRLLTGSLDEDTGVWAVATVRSEFLSSDPERAGLAEAVDDPLVIEPLSHGRLAEVIARPAQRAGLEFAPGLVERMVDETTGGDALPLLAYTLRELFQRAGPVGRIGVADYETVGGVVGALEHRADRLTDELARRGLGERVIPVLLRLADVTGAEEPTRRRVRLSTLSADERVVVDAFVDARLLTSGRGSGENGTGEATVEVAHEALLRQWPPLRRAIEADRAGLRLRSDLERMASEWQQGHRDESYLLRGSRLATVDHWAREHGEELDALEQRFLQASHAAAAHELEVAHRSNRRLRVLAGGLTLLLVATVAVGGMAWYQNQRAQASARLAWARQFADRANQLVDTQPDVAILAGLQSVSLARGQHLEPPPGLVSGLARTSHASRLLSGFTWPVAHVTFSLDDRLLATTSAGTSTDYTVRLWDAGTGRPHGPPLDGHTGAVTAVAFTEGGRLLLTASTDGTVRQWDVATGRPRGQPEVGQAEWGRPVAFSPDGRLLATVEDGALQLWDVATGRPRGTPLVGHTEQVRAAAFSADGQLLASGGADRTVRLWDVATGRPQGPPLAGHTGEVGGVAFSPDGRLLATTSDDQTVRLWDVTTGQPHGQPLTGHTGTVLEAAFTPDGRLLATAGADRTVRLWDVATGRAHGSPLVGHTDEVNTVVFSSNGAVLATSSDDQTVRLWQVAETFSISQPLAGHTGAVYRVAFSHDGRLLATSSSDGTVRLWDVAARQPHGPPLTGHTGEVYDVAFSRDDRLLATTGVDNTVRLWDVTTGQPHGPPLTGHDGIVWAVAFSPDGHLMASGGADGTVRLWDVATATAHGSPLTGHTGEVDDVAFSPDGQLIGSTSTDETVRLWDVATGRPHGSPLIGHTAAVNGVAYSPDGRLLATSSRDGTVRLWEVAAGGSHGPLLSGHTGAVAGVAFSPDGTMVATASTDTTVRLWNPEFTSWVPTGCALVNRNLSLDEWDQVARGLPYERTCPDLPPGRDAPRDAPAASYSG